MRAEPLWCIRFCNKSEVGAPSPEYKHTQAGRRLVRSLLTVGDIGVSLHPWAYVDNK